MNRIVNLFSVYVITQSLFFGVSFFTPDDNFSNRDLSYATFFHAASMISVTIGYFIPKLGKVNKPVKHVDSIFLKKGFFLTSYLLLLFGVYISILQVAIFEDPIQYLNKLLIQREFDQNIRMNFLTSAQDGGISGFFKMFGYSTISIYLFSFSLINFFGSRFKNKELKELSKLNLIALIATVIRSLFSLDRLTIAAIFLANLFIFIKYQILKGRFKLSKVIQVVLSLIAISFLSASRLKDAGILDFVFLYYRLGLVNLQLVMETADGYSYGFSSLLFPVTFISRFAGIYIDPPIPNFQWEVNTAQYIVGYMYLDFGILSLIAFFLLGLMFKVVDYKSLKLGRVSYSAIYFIVLYWIISLSGVPVSNGIDFWLSFFLPLILTRVFLIINYDKVLNKSMAYK